MIKKQKTLAEIEAHEKSKREREPITKKPLQRQKIS